MSWLGFVGLTQAGVTQKEGTLIEEFIDLSGWPTDKAMDIFLINY